jgi:ubiquinol-cytochrome c reductase iron-sulfur subunit
MAQALTGNNLSPPDGTNRRDFLEISAGAFAAIGAAAALWPFVDSMNPAADVRALATVEVDLAPIDIGQRITVKWRGRPVFIVRRSPEVIARARADDNSPDLIDPTPDSARVQRAEWLIVTGVCTHLGCASRLGSERGTLKGYMMAGFAPVMARSTT